MNNSQDSKPSGFSDIDDHTMIDRSDDDLENLSQSDPTDTEMGDADEDMTTKTKEDAIEAKHVSFESSRVFIDETESDFGTDFEGERSPLSEKEVLKLLKGKYIKSIHIKPGQIKIRYHEW